MRILRGDLLRLHCRCPLQDVRVIDLRRCGVESLTPPAKEAHTSLRDGPVNGRDAKVPSVEMQQNESLGGEVENCGLNGGVTERSEASLAVRGALNVGEENAAGERPESPADGGATIVQLRGLDRDRSRQGRMWEYSAHPLGECLSLEILLLSENKLANLEGIQRCHSFLWKLDAKFNMISDLNGLEPFTQLGELNLSNNLIDYDQLLKISHIHIMSLNLDANPALLPPSKGDEEHGLYARVAAYRRNVIYLLPLVWILDGYIVTAEEREHVASFFESAENLDEVSSKVKSLAGRVGKPRSSGKKLLQGWGTSSLSIFDTTGNVSGGGEERQNTQQQESKEDYAWGWAMSRAISGDTKAPTLLREAILSQPIGVRRQAHFRLSHIVALHNLSSKSHDEFFARNAVKVGLDTISMGSMDVSALLKIPYRQRLDLAVLLAVTVEFDVPAAIIRDSLALLLKMDLSAAQIRNLADLPPYGRTLICRALRSVAVSELRNGQHVATSEELQYSELEQELLNAVPKSGGTLPLRVGELLIPNAEAHSADDAEERRIALELRARHAIILLSRSPIFPPLLQKKQANAALRHVYERLTPLLQTGGMAAGDLEDSDGNKVAPRIEHPVWSPVTSDTGRTSGPDQEQEETVGSDELRKLSNLEKDQLMALLESQEGDESDEYENYMSKYNFDGSANDDQITPPGVKLEDAEVPSACFAYYEQARVPRVGEMVEIAYGQNRYFPRILALTEESNAVCLEPLNIATVAGGDEVWLGIRELFWNPNGYWRHQSASAAGNERIRRLARKRASKLHRTNRGLSKSGVSLARDVSNSVLPPQLMQTIESNPAQKRKPKMLRCFTADSSWDPHFVLAPPKLVHAQNAASGGGGNWREVERPSYSIKGPGAVYGPMEKLVERQRPLGVPGPSAVYQLLRSQLYYNEEIKREREERAVVHKEMANSNKQSSHNESSFFDLTALPASAASTQNDSKNAIATDKPIHPDNSSAQGSKPRSIESRQRDHVIRALFEQELHILQSAPKATRRRAAGPTEWFTHQPKAGLVVSQSQFEATRHRARKSTPIELPSLKTSERSRLIQKHKNRRLRDRKMKQRGSIPPTQQRFTTIKASTDATLKVFAAKGQIVKRIPRTASHAFIPVEQGIPNPLLPTPGISAGMHAKKKQLRHNKLRRSSLTQRLRVEVSASVPNLRP